MCQNIAWSQIYVHLKWDNADEAERKDHHVQIWWYVILLI